MTSRHPIRLSLATLAVVFAIAGSVSPAVASDPPANEPVTLPDGTVLPPPPEAPVPTVQGEMLAEHGGAAEVVPVESSIASAEGTEELKLEATAPIVQAEGGQVGPGGPLPNGLRREVLGFLPYWMLDPTTISHLRLDLVSTVAYFSVGVQPNGYLARGPSSARTVGWNGWTSSAMTQLIDAAHARGVKVVLTITMMAWDGDYSGMSQLLNNATYRARLVDDIATVVGGRNADGVNVDFEPVPTSLRSQFTSFVRELKAGLVSRGVGSYVTVDTMAGAASWSTGYDVVGLTAPGAADALMVMAYDFSWSGSARAGGVAPLESDYIFSAGDALRAHLARVPANKLIWGVPYYGRAWNTADDSQNALVRSPAQSVAFSYYWNDGGTPAGGKVLAQQHGRRWDATGQVPWFAFRNSDGGWRQGYYDDPTSLRAKYDMVLDHGLAGIGIWALGMDTGVGDLWSVIQDRFGRTQRIAGSDRYGTAAAISRAAFSAGVPVAYVATGASYPDALAGGPAAARAGGPMLLVSQSHIPSATQAELARLRPARIVVLGGPSAVSDGVLNALRPYAAGGRVDRISGSDRYATAAAVSAEFFAQDAPVAYIATGASFPDALTGGVAAGRDGGPLLLVAPGAIPNATAAELERLRPSRIVVLGGSSAVSDGVLNALRPYATSGTVTRLAGPNRYATAIEVSRATTASGAAPVVYVATGQSFADGLAGTPVAARARVPLLIVPSSGLPLAVANELKRLGPGRVILLGGPRAIPESLAEQIASIWD